MAGLQEKTLRIVLVGKRGNGKSATANTILGRNEFASRISAQAVTKTCQTATQNWKGRNLLVVDTPGLFDTKETLMNTCKEISLCVLFSRPGPHAIILVVQLGQFTEEDSKTIALMKHIFGEEAVKYMIVLFTHKDTLGDDQELSEFIEDSDVDLGNIVQECGDRCCAFNNRSADEAEREGQVQELVELIEKMVQENGETHFSDAIYKDVEEKLRKQEEALEIIYADELGKKIKLIKGQNMSQQEKEEKIKSLKMNYDEQIKNIQKEAGKKTEKGLVGTSTPEPPDTNMAGRQEKTLRIVLVGKTGNGKSATANTILGRKEFASRIAAQAVTKKCQTAGKNWKGRNLLVVDTPGLFDTEETLKTTCEEISYCVIASSPGPHAIILVVQLGRFTDEDYKTIALIKHNFGKEAMKYMIVLFTRKDMLEGQSLSEFIEKADVDLRNIVQECGDRCCAFNNRSTDETEREGQVQELVELIEKTVQENGGTHFSDAIYKDIEEKLRKQEEALERIYAEQLEKEIKLVKNIKISEEDKEEKINALRKKYDERIKDLRNEAGKNVFNYVVNKISEKLSAIWHTFWK